MVFWLLLFSPLALLQFMLHFRPHPSGKPATNFDSQEHQPRRTAPQTRWADLLKNNQSLSTRGGKRDGAGRKAGVPNKVTAVLKDAILLAAERVGADGEGEGGLTGYLESMAKEDRKSFTSLLGRVVPTQTELTGKDGEDLSINFKTVYESKRGS